MVRMCKAGLHDLDVVGVYGRSVCVACRRMMNEKQQRTLNRKRMRQLRATRKKSGQQVPPPQEPSLADAILDLCDALDTCAVHWERSAIQAQIDLLVKEHQRRMRARTQADDK